MPPHTSRVAPSATVGAVFAFVYLVIAGIILLASSTGKAHEPAAPAGPVAVPPPYVGGYGVVTPTTTATTTTTAPDIQTTAPSSDLPAGHQQVSGPGGIRLAIPSGWQPTAGPVSGNAQANDPANADRFVRYGATPAPRVDLLTEIRAGARTNPNIRNGYKEIHLQLISFDSTEAVDWEFTFIKNGVARHARGYYWRVNGYGYVIYASAPSEQWSVIMPVFNLMAGTATAR